MTAGKDVAKNGEGEPPQSILVSTFWDRSGSQTQTCMNQDMGCPVPTRPARIAAGSLSAIRPGSEASPNVRRCSSSPIIATALLMSGFSWCASHEKRNARSHSSGFRTTGRSKEAGKKSRRRLLFKQDQQVNLMPRFQCSNNSKKFHSTHGTVEFIRTVCSSRQGDTSQGILFTKRR